MPLLVLSKHNKFKNNQVKNHDYLYMVGLKGFFLNFSISISKLMIIIFFSVS